jgi:outer membrane receptor protein involved in Fe transport
MASAELTKNFELGLTFDSLNFKWVEFSPETPPLTQSNLEAAANGGRVPYKYTFHGTYHLPLDSHIGDISLKANWAWQAEQSIACCIRGAPGSVIPAYGILNLSADWNRIGGSAVDAQLFATNVLNKTYTTSAGYDGYYLAGMSASVYGPPRMYGIRLRCMFGADAK